MAHDDARGRVPLNARELLLVGGFFLCLAMVAYLPAWIHGPASEIATGGGKDNPSGVWWMAWDAWAVTHAANPFYSRMLNAPVGVNLMLNPAPHFVDWLMTPVTIWLGPVVAWTVAATLTIAADALAAFVLIRRFTGTWAAVPGALFYGFGPYVAAHATSTLNLIVIVFPPLILAATHRLLVSEEVRPLRTGMLIGLLCVMQFLSEPEVLAELAVVALLGVVWILLDVRGRLAIWKQGLRRLAVAGLGAVGVFVPLAAYPLWMITFGPGHISVGPFANEKAYRADLLSAIVPTPNQLLGPAHLKAMADGWVNRLPVFLPENDAYLGIGLLLVVLVGAVWLRRERIVQVSVIGLLACYAASLGNRLQLHGHLHRDVPLPFAILDRVGFGLNFVAPRFAAFTDLFAGLLLSVVIARAVVAVRGRIGDREQHRLVVSLVAAGVTAVALVPALPNWPMRMTSTQEPVIFADHGGAPIPPGARVLTYPIPRGPTAAPMLWQAEDAFRYSLVAGYFIGVGSNGKSTFYSGQTWLDALLIKAYLDQDRRVSPVTSLEIAMTREDLRSSGVTTIVVTDAGPQTPFVVSLFQAAIGRAPQTIDGAWVWFAVDRDIGGVSDRGTRERG